MIVETICDACGMEYDWPGIQVGDLVYCCAACSRGEPCTCPQHDHGYAVAAPATGETVKQVRQTTTTETTVSEV